MVCLRTLASALLLIAALSSPSEAMTQERVGPGVVLFGRVLDAGTGVPVAEVVVQVEGLNLITVTDTLGRYRLAGVSPGPQVLYTERIGYASARVPVTVPAEGTLPQDIILAESALAIEGITVTADAAGRARGELGTASVIASDAIRHQTATSLSGVLELVPGVTLSPPGLGTVQQMPLRAAPTVTRGTESSATDLASFGTLIILDGVPLSNNANLQSLGPRGELSFATSAGGGIDLRRIPASTIERVEVIRGVPSARYGDLTQGAIVVDTRAGAFEPELSAHYDARTGEGSVVVGRALGDPHVGTLTLDVARTRSQAGISQDHAYRVAGQLAHRAHWGQGLSGRDDNRGVLDTRVDFFQLFDDRPENPNVRPGRAFWSRDSGVRLSERARLLLSGDAGLSLAASISRIHQRSYSRAQAVRSVMPFTDRLTEGRAVGHFIIGQYVAEVDADGSPWLAYSRMEADATRNWIGFSHELRTGFELQREWTGGPGYQFDIERPPQVLFNGVQGFDRPRRYDDVPPLATSGFYLDDRVSRALPLGMFLTVQAGMRMDVLHRGAHWFSGARDVALQPRVNVEIAPWLWLRLRGGWGRAVKTPSLADLYPAPQYYDVVNVNWFANNPAERLAVLTTYILDSSNPQLGYTVADKAEAGIEMGAGASALAVVVFRDHITGGIGIETEPRFLLRDHYQLSDSSSGTGRPPQILEPATHADTVPVLLQRPANNLTLDNRGIELTASLPEISPFRTRFQLQGAWIRTERVDRGIDFGPGERFSEFQLTERRLRAPYWEGREAVGESFLMTYRLIHHQPELGLVLTTTIQHNIRDVLREAGRGDTLAFAGYITRAGRLVAVPAERRSDPEFRDLRDPRGGVLVVPLTAPADWMLSVQASKSLPLGGSLRFWAFNALDRVGKYQEPEVRARLYPHVRVGLELTMPANALFAWRD